VLPVLQLAEELAPNENELFPDTFEANVDIFLRAFWLPHLGQATSITAPFRTNSSNGAPQAWHSNSKIGIRTSHR
jgi:hypothetical protein